MPDNAAGSLFARTLRVTKLAAGGTPLVGANNCYVTSSLVTIGVGLAFTENEAVEQKNGRGQTCVYYKPKDTVLGGTISAFTVCKPDPALTEFLIGGNVLLTGGTNEVQTVTISGVPTGGTFTLNYDGQVTAAIAYNATAATVQAALIALSNLAPGDVTVTGTAGGPWTVTFGGARAGINVPQITAVAAFTGGTTPAVTVATTTQGGGGTVRGYAAPEVNTDPTPFGVGLEVWTNAMVDNAVDPALPYWQWVLGTASLRMPEGVVLGAENAATPTFEGTIAQNLNFGSGPVRDIVFPTSRVYQYLQVATEPAADGYVTVLAPV